MLTVTSWINNGGIILEIVGFVLMVFAVSEIKGGGGSFTSSFDNIGRAIVTMHKRIYLTGIAFVIVGLVLQFIATTIS